MIKLNRCMSVILFFFDHQKMASTSNPRFENLLVELSYGVESCKPLHPTQEQELVIREEIQRELEKLAIIRSKISELESVQVSYSQFEDICVKMRELRMEKLTIQNRYKEKINDLNPRPKSKEEILQILKPIYSKFNQLLIEELEELKGALFGRFVEEGEKFLENFDSLEEMEVLIQERQELYSRKAFVQDMLNKIDGFTFRHPGYVWRGVCPHPDKVEKKGFITEFYSVFSCLTEDCQKLRELLKTKYRISPPDYQKTILQIVKDVDCPDANQGFLGKAVVDDLNSEPPKLKSHDGTRTYKGVSGYNFIRY